MDKKYSEADIEGAVRQIKFWLNKPGKGRSKAALARIAGISPAAVGQILSGRYPADPSAHLEAMTAAVDREQEREREPAEIPYTETSVAKMVRSVIRRAHQDRDFGIFAGRVGVGKTVALRHYAAEHQTTAVLIEAYPGAGAPVVLRLIASSVNALITRRTVADTTAAIVETLRGSDRVILVDEAETLTPQALLHLRRISDAARVGVVLAGTPGLMALVHDPDGKFGQITSRIGWWPPLCQSISAEDAALLTAAYLGEDLAAETQKALWEACQGSARALRNLLRHARRRQAKHDETGLTAELIRRVDRHAMGGRRLAA